MGLAIQTVKITSTTLQSPLDNQLSNHRNRKKSFKKMLGKITQFINKRRPLPRLYPYAPFSEMLANRYPQSVRWSHYRAIIGDLGDTIISGEPMVEALQGAFLDVTGLSISTQTIYDGFGMPKERQIKQILLLPSSQQTFARTPSLNDIQTIHNQFERRLRDYYNRYGVHYLEGTHDAIRMFHRQGVRFGCTTGLSNDMIEVIEKRLPLWRPHPIVFCERPSPNGIFKIIDEWNRGLPTSQHIQLNQVLKIGDSQSDLAEAKAAGVSFVGVTRHRAKAISKMKHSSSFQTNVVETDLRNEFILQGAVETVGTLDELALLFCPWMKLGYI